MTDKQKESIVAFYLKEIKAEKMTIEDVPQKIRSDVESALKD